MSDVLKLNIKSKKLKIVSDKQLNQSIIEKLDEDTLEQKLQMAYQKGFEDGSKQGSEEKETFYENILYEKNQEFFQILSEMENKYIEFEQAFAKIVIEISTKIASKIIKREVEIETTIEHSMTESLRQVISANKIIVRLNPKDKSLLELKREEIGEGNKFSKFQFEADNSIEQGGCYIETELGNVDGRISKQLEEINRILEQKFIVREGDVNS